MARFATRPAALAALAVLALAVPASAANVVLVNLDPPGFGLNDPTPVAPVGGNPGVTLGEQRTNVYLFAAQLWGAVLDSTVPIYVGATFQPLACSPTGGTLGAAGATYVHRDFPGAGVPGTWYHTALADSLVGANLVNDIDVISFFNSDVDTNPNCLTGRTWYYGFDHNEGINLDFLNVVMHEIGHGVGFSNFTNEATGQFLGGQPYPGIYDHFTLDLTTGKTWNEMTDAERVASAINSGNVVWSGSAVTAVAPSVLGPRPSVKVLNTGLGSLEAMAASFGAPLDADEGTTGQVVVANDGVGDPKDACQPLLNNASDKIVLSYRGTCAFTVKALNAQAAGAKGLIVANNAPTGLAPMGGSDPNVVIPAVGISMADGGALEAAHHPVVKLILDEDFLAGAAPTGQVRLYAPNPVAPGSSLSHWDTGASPNLLMEPFINSDLEAANDLDLTPFLFMDIGWSILP